MAWFLNFYRCAECKRIWTDEWSCMCDDDCPNCGARHMSPFDSENLTENGTRLLARHCETPSRSPSSDASDEAIQASPMKTDGIASVGAGRRQRRPAPSHNEESY